MLSLENLTERALLSGMSGRELGRTEACLGRMIDPARDGQMLAAQVQEDGDVYDVEVTCTPDEILCRCTCNARGPCKHAYGLLLKWLREPQAFVGRGQPIAPEERPLAVTPAEPPPTQRPDQPPAWATTPFAQRQAGHVERLAGWLDRIRLQDLRQMARRRGWRLKGTDKAGIVGQVAEAMAAPEGALATALALDDELRRVLAALIVLGFGVKMETVARLAESWGKLTQSRQFAAYTLRLQEAGLALPAAADSYGPFGDFCPDMVARWLLPVVHPVLLAAGPAKPAPQADVRLADPFPFIRAVSEVALLLERTAPALRPPMPRPAIEKQFAGLRGWDYDPREVRQAQLSRRLQMYSELVLTVPPPSPSLADDTIAQLAPVAGDASRLEFIYALLVAAGVLQPGSPVTTWPEVKRQYLCRDEDGQRAILARTYFTMTNWSELWEMWPAGVSPLQVKRHAGYAYYTQDKLRADLATCRLLVLRALACLPDGEWVRMEDLYRLLRVIWPRFDDAVRQTASHYGPSSAWFLAEPGSDARLAPTHGADWERAQGCFARRMLAGPLHWLGLADLSYEAGTPTAFRLHGLADLFWDRTEAPPAPPHAVARGAVSASSAPAVVVKGEQISVRPAAINAQAHGLLEQVARLEAATAGRFEYRLDAAATYQAFQAGAALSEILDGWQQLLPVPMPEAVRAQLTRWWEAYGSVRIYQGLTVVELADDYALAELKATTSLAQHIVAEVSPRLVIVENGAVELLVAELEKAGYTPKRTDQV